MHIATGNIRASASFLASERAPLFPRPLHYTYEQARTSPINWIATNTRCINELWAEREREKEREGENEGDDVVCSILHFLFHPLASCLHVEFQLPPSIVRTRTHKYICILAGSFSGSGSMRTSISASMYLQPFLEGFARSVSVFDHHSLPSHRCLTISRQQFNYLPCSRFRFPRSFDFSLVTGYKDISSSTCSYCVDLL